MKKHAAIGLTGWAALSIIALHACGLHDYEGWIDMEEPAPGFSLTDQNPASSTFGQERNLDSMQGKVVVLYFAGFG